MIELVSPDKERADAAPRAAVSASSILEPRSSAAIMASVAASMVRSSPPISSSAHLRHLARFSGGTVLIFNTFALWQKCAHLVSYVTLSQPA